MIKYEEFEKVDVRIGRIIKVQDTEGLRNPSYLSQNKLVTIHQKP